MPRKSGSPILVLSPMNVLVVLGFIFLALPTDVRSAPVADPSRQHRLQHQHARPIPKKQHPHHSAHGAIDAERLVPVVLPMATTGQPFVKVESDILRRGPYTTTGDLVRSKEPRAANSELIEPRHYASVEANTVKVHAASVDGTRYRLAATQPKKQHQHGGSWYGKGKNDGNRGKQHWQSNTGKQQQQYDDQYGDQANNYAVAQNQPAAVYYQAVPVAPPLSRPLVDLNLNLKRNAPEELFNEEGRAGFAAAAHVDKHLPVAAGPSPSDVGANANATFNPDENFILAPLRQGVIKLPHFFHEASSGSSTTTGTSETATPSVSSTESATISSSSTASAAGITAATALPTEGGSLINLDLGILKRREAPAVPLPSGQTGDFFLVPSNDIPLPQAVQDAANAVLGRPSDEESEPETSATGAAFHPSAPVPLSPPVAVPTDGLAAAAQSATERRPTVLEPQALVQAAVFKELANKNKLTPWVAPANFAQAPPGSSPSSVAVLPKDTVEAM